MGHCSRLAVTWTPRISSGRLLLTRGKATLAAAVAAEEDSLSEDAKPFDAIPSVRTVPFLKHAWVYLPIVGRYDKHKLHEVSFQRFKELGPIVREDIGSVKPFVHLYDAADIEKAFRNEGRYPLRLGLKSLMVYRSLRPEIFTKTGLSVMQGKEWKDFRSKVQGPILKPASIEYYIPAFQTVTDAMVQLIRKKRDKNGEVPNLLQDLYQWALESVCLVALDTRLGCFEDSPSSEALDMIDAANYIFHYLGVFELSILRLWEKFPTPKWRRFEKYMDIFSNTSAAKVKAAMDRLPKSIDDDTKLTYLQYLLVKNNFSTGEAVTMATDMMLGGIDTTSHAFSFLLMHLSSNPEVQEKAAQEVLKYLPNKDDPITPEILDKLHYVKACVKESMRISPIVDGTSRTLDKDMVFSGYKVPAGVQLLFHNMVVARQEKYFYEPEKYIPERWLNKTEDHKNNPFAFVPFGFGPRMCVGRRIAEHEIWLLLTKVLRNFRVEYPYEEPVGMKFRLVNVPDRDLRYQFKDRV